MAESHSTDATPEDEAFVNAKLERITGSKVISLNMLGAVCAETAKPDEMASIGRVAFKYGILEIAANIFSDLKWKDAQQIIAVRALDIGQYRLACRIFKSFKDIEHLHTLVTLAIQAKDFKSAYEAVKFLDDKEGLREVGAASVAAGNYFIAELAYEEVGDLKGLHTTAKAAIKTGDFKIGLDLLRRELERVEKFRNQVFRDFSEAGLAAMERKNLQAAMEAFEKAKDKIHARELGNIAIRIKNFKLAIKAFSVAGDQDALKFAQTKFEEQNERNG